MLLITLACLSLTQMTSTFLLNDKCTGPSPCVCSGDFINCDSNGLPTVPTFARSGKTYNTIILHLDGNLIQNITDSAFVNINLSVNADMHLHLNSNRIELISDNAFAGIEDNVVSCNLSSNRLTHLPTALGKLTNITELYLVDNLLISLDGNVMLKLGHSLTTFSLGLGSLLSWPYQLHFLRRLQTFNAYDVPFRHIDASAFHGFETTLEYLYMKDSQLVKIPHAVCRLNNLKEFTYLDSTPDDSHSAVLDACVNKLKNVSKIFLVGNSLQKFPDVLNMFPGLQILKITGNNISVINGDLIPANMQVGSLQLSDNQFYRIPMAVNNFPNVTYLDLRNNNIQSVEDPDLANLKDLHTLILSDNPIEYISGHAFDNNVNLRILRLQNTLLGKIPRGVVTLTSLSYLGISGQPIECTCRMSYLKNWAVSHVNLEGNCEFSLEPLKSYLMQSVPACP